MLSFNLPLPVKFICAFIYSNEDTYNATKAILSKKYGPIDFESNAIDFKYTDYYENEMGKILFRRFISFKKLQKPDHFIDIKLLCTKLEKKYAPKDKRIINIDPGYLNEAKLVLTTTKDFSHRIYLGKGVYAEVTLYFKDGNFCDFATTFPDYRTPEYKSILNTIRDIYRDQIHNINK